MGKKIKGLFGELDAAMKRNGRRELDKLLRGETKTQAVAKAKAQAGEEIAKLKAKIAALESENERLKKQNEALTEQNKKISEQRTKALKDFAAVMKRANESSIAMTKMRRKLAEVNVMKRECVHIPAPPGVAPFRVYMENQGEGKELLMTSAVGMDGIMFILRAYAKAASRNVEANAVQICDGLKNDVIAMIRAQRAKSAPAESSAQETRFTGNLEMDFLGRKEK